MGKCAFDQRLRRGVPVFLQEVFFQTSAVDADVDRNMMRPAAVGDRLDPVLLADVSGVDADFGSARLSGKNGKAVVKVNVGN